MSSPDTALLGSCWGASAQWGGQSVAPPLFGDGGLCQQAFAAPSSTDVDAAVRPIHAAVADGGAGAEGGDNAKTTKAFAAAVPDEWVRVRNGDLGEVAEPVVVAVGVERIADAEGEDAAENLFTVQ